VATHSCDIATFGVFTAMKVQVQIFWVVIPYSDVVVYHCFGDHTPSIFRAK